MRKLKVFFHDNCFDGAASAALFTDFYLAQVDADAEVHYQGVQHRPGDPFEGYPIDGDDNACLDFRYCADERMNWWFDHHASAFQPPELRSHFEADTSGKKFYDPTARSNTKFEVGCFRREFGYTLPNSLEDLVYWADIIDGAQFSDAQTAVELREPALQIMTWLENNDEPELTHRLIRAFRTDALSKIAVEPWIRQPLAPLLERHTNNISLIRSRATCDRHVVFFDLIDAAKGGYNKFISYFLFPEARYTVGLSNLGDRIKISVGSNPWSSVERTHNIAAICERYGGGGHPVVGAIGLPLDQADRAREIAATILEELRE